MIASPKISADHPDRPLECEVALEDAFRAVASDAERAGWSGTEVEQALLALALAHMKAREANLDTDAAIRAAWLRIRQP